MIVLQTSALIFMLTCLSYILLPCSAFNASIPTVTPFALPLSPNVQESIQFTGLSPIIRQYYIFQPMALLGPFAIPRSAFASSNQTFVLSVTFIQTAINSVSYTQCRYDALMTDNRVPGSYWWEPLQDLLTSSPEIAELFEQTVVANGCQVHNGRNVLKASLNNSNSLLGSHLLSLNLPINRTSVNESVLTTSFMMDTSRFLAWMPTQVHWTDIPVFWWDSIGQQSVSVTLNVQAAIVTTWCGDRGYIMLLQCGANETTNENALVEYIYVLEISYALDHGGTVSWNISSLQATSRTKLDAALLQDLTENQDRVPQITFCYQQPTVTQPQLYYLNPSTYTVWQLNTTTGWRVVEDSFRNNPATVSVNGHPPSVIVQSYTQPPVICWIQKGCTIFQATAHNHFTFSALTRYAFNDYIYDFVWSLTNITLHMVTSSGEHIMSTGNWASVSTSPDFFPGVPRLTYADALSNTMLDSSSSVRWRYNSGEIEAYDSIVGIGTQIFAYSCSLFLTDSVCDQTNDQTVVQFDVQMRTMNILTVVGSLLPPLVDNGFHSVITLTTLPSPFADGTQTSECLIYTLSPSVSEVPQAFPIWVFSPAFRQFYFLGTFDVALWPEIVLSEVFAYSFSGGIVPNQIICSVSLYQLKDFGVHPRYYSYVLLMGVISETGGIEWQPVWPSSYITISTPPLTISQSSRIFQGCFPVRERDVIVQVFSVLLPNDTVILSAAAVCYPSLNNTANCSLQFFTIPLQIYDQPIITPLTNGIIAVLLMLEPTAESGTVADSGLLLLDVFSGQLQTIYFRGVISILQIVGVYLAEAKRFLAISEAETYYVRKTLAVQLQCPAGMYDAQSGTLLSAPAASLCTPCPVGTWNDLVGVSSCNPCIYPLQTSSCGSTNSTACNVCPSSYCHGKGVCLLTDAGAACQCDFGYSQSDRCALPWLMIIVISILGMTSLITFSVIRYRKFKADQRHNQSKMLREISVLKQAWEIEWSALSELKILASGGFGCVFEGRWCDRSVAVKVMHDVEVHHSQDFEREARALRQYRHPQIVLFFGIGRNPDLQQFIVTEFVERGSLRNVIEAEDLQSEMLWGVRLSMSIDISTGLEFLHRQIPPVIHRDLKSPNILVTSSFRCKIGDLGTARLIEISTKQYIQQKRRLPKIGRKRSGTMMSIEDHRVQLLDETCMSRRVGTTKWAAPEILRGESNYGLPVDIYACGIVFWEIMTGQLPFEDILWSWEVAQAVQEGRRPEWPVEHFASGNEDYVRLAEACWAAEPSERPDAATVLERMVLMV